MVVQTGPPFLWGISVEGEFPFLFKMRGLLENGGMNTDEHLQRHLELCRRVFQRMLAEDSWPWKEEPDSTEPEDMVESDDILDDV